MAVVSERSAVRRLYDRFGFGARPDDLAQSFDAALERLLGESGDGAVGPAPPELPAIPKAGKDDAAAKKQARRERAAQDAQLVGWWLDRMVASGVARERLTWFWHGHFATSAQKVKVPALMLAQNETFRRMGLDRFADLAKALVVDPAMIRWLDGDDNRVGSPNENLAREFMELFTLGVGHYTEDDVREAARALTGWAIDKKTGAARLVAKQHDDKDKEILGETANFTAESFVDRVLSRPESSRFVVGRLWFRLVSATPPDDAAVDRLLTAYGDGGDIRATLRAVAAEPAFRAEESTLVKQPVEWLVGLLRALGVRPSDLDDKTRAQVYKGLMGLGQVPFRPPSVGGWPAGPAWLTTAAGLTRLRLASTITAKANLDSLAQQEDRVAGVGALLCVDAWSDRTTAALAEVAREPAQVAAIAACAPEYVVSA
jgi:uncharacterized protein (DUF1800 family)